MSNVHLFKSMDSPSNSSCQRYCAAGSALLEEVVYELLEETVSELLEEFLESLDSSRLSPLRMTDEEDSAELSITLSLELERRFPLEAGMTKDELVSAGMTEEEDSAELSAGPAKLGDASSEHAAKATIPTAAMNLYPIKPTPYFFTLRRDLPGGRAQSRQLWLALP